MGNINPMRFYAIGFTKAGSPVDTLLDVDGPLTVTLRSFIAPSA
jgi:hypothetical protein